MRRLVLVGLLFAFCLVGIAGCGSSTEPVPMTDKSFTERLKKTESGGKKKFAP